MNKAELVAKIAEESKLTKKAAETALEAFVTSVQEALKNIDMNEVKVDLSEYAKIEYVDEKIAEIVIPEVPSIEGLASEEFVQEQIAAIEHPQYDDSELRERVEVLETINLETKPYIDKNGMLVLCGCPAVARGVGEEVHVTVRFFNDEEDKFVFTKEEFAKFVAQGEPH